MTDHGRTTLAGILPDRKDLLEICLKKLKPEHFTDPSVKTLYQLVQRYFDQTGAIITEINLIDTLKRMTADVGRQAHYLQLFRELSKEQIADHEVRYALDALIEQRAYSLTQKALTDSMEVLVTGRTDNKGVEIKGQEEARRQILLDLADIENDLAQGDSPEGNMRREAVDMKADYADRKANKGKDIVLTGIHDLDMITGGHQRGELILYCGYAGQGKTTMCAQLAWDAVVNQRKNVYFLTSETLRKQVRRKIISRHSRLPQFGVPDGLNSKRIKDGTLTELQESQFYEVVDDFQQNPTYGNLHIAQAPNMATIPLIGARAQRLARLETIDLIVIDYIALLRAERARQNINQEMSELIKAGKNLAASFNDGEGVPVVSPWQVAKEKFEKALTRGEYQLGDLAETSEAEKSADLIVSFLRFPDTPEEVKAQILKNRDGETGANFTLQVDYATSYLAPKTTISEIDSLLEDD